MAPHIEMIPKCQLSKQLTSSWLVFIGVCGNIPGEKKNSSTANTGVFLMDSLSSRHQGGLSPHTQDQERTIEELEMAQTQSLLRGQRPQLSTLPLKVVIPMVHSLEFRGKGHGTQQPWLQSPSLLSIGYIKWIEVT